MSTHQLATGHATPKGLHNPIFWALILLCCLEASQTESNITIMNNAINRPSSSSIASKLSSKPAARQPEEATRSGFFCGCQAISNP